MKNQIGLLNQKKGGGLLEFTQGIDCDQRLAACEIQTQKAWVNALARSKLLTPTESTQVTKALNTALEEIQKGSFEWRIEDEDVHMNLERYLTDSVGELGKRIHFGRSRNDLIATTLRLFVNQGLLEVSELTENLSKTLSLKGKETKQIIVPGMTHLQHGQPISLGLFFESHAQAFLRDVETYNFAAKTCLSTLPLGSGALAGTTLQIDLQDLATELGFSSPPKNSYDSVSDRDFILQALFSFAQCATHISRLSEDIIFYASSAVGLFKLPYAYSTGSSLMPNKRNPDVAELSRAKSARIQTALTEGLAIMKGLPLAYNSDLHELKRTYLRSFDEISAVLHICMPFIKELSVDGIVAKNLCMKGHILATDIADNLVTKKSATFREAYRTVAKWVENAETQQKQIHEIAEAQELSGHPDPFLESVGKRSNCGGTHKALSD